jgi:hypothetical protein
LELFRQIKNQIKAHQISHRMSHSGMVLRAIEMVKMALEETFPQNVPTRSTFFTLQSL